jgi:outer membrane protein, heavy metal efflux system
MLAFRLQLAFAPLALALALMSGCQVARPQTQSTCSWARPAAIEQDGAAATTGRPHAGVVTASAVQEAAEAPAETELAALVSEALATNPQIRRLESLAAAAWARVPQVHALPDPMVGGTVFGEPQHMPDGQMRGTFMVSQQFPSFKLLGARGQEAAFEALMLQQEANAARLQIAADVEEAWHRLFLLGQLLRINEANRQLISPLVDVATARVEVGQTTPGDVVLGTLELSRIEEERLTLQQQLAARKATLNRLLNRPADSPLPTPRNTTEKQLNHSLEALRGLTFDRQPEIVAARLRTEATAWGVRVARLERVPEVNLSYEHMFMSSNPGEDASDPWRVGVDMNVPLWHRKYRAMEREARQENLAAHQQVEELMHRYDAELLDLLEQAKATSRTARLYRETILPQARQALEVDQRAYGQGTVTFERVITDARTILTAEAAYFRAVADRAIAITRLKQAAGGQLPAGDEELRQPELLPAPAP